MREMESSEESPELLLTNCMADAALRGELEQFSALYERVSPSLHVWGDLRLPAWIRSQVGPDDLVQEVWARAMLKFAAFDPTRAPFRRWLFGVGRRVLSDFLRRGLRHQQGTIKHDVNLTNFDVLPADVTTLARRVARKSAGEGLAREIRELEEEDQRLVLLRALEEKSHEQVAEDLGISLESAKKKWQRLRKRLEERGLSRLILDEE